MARDIFGNRRITKEDLYTKKTFTSADSRWEYYKMVSYIVIGYLYFHFIIMGWSY